MSPHSAQPRSASHHTPRPPRLGRRMARFNRAVTNRVSIHVAGRLPGLGIVIHVGRRTRTVYRTPVNVFRTKDGFRFSLTYGADAEWVRNALAHGAVRLITRGKEYELTDPEVVTDPHRQHVPAIARGLLRVMRVSQFLDFTRAGNGMAPATGGVAAP
jgi:deazaflavin-dependent oxidoreductase (nitroreductase family)